MTDDEPPAVGELMYVATETSDIGTETCNQWGLSSTRSKTTRSPRCENTRCSRFRRSIGSARTTVSTSGSKSGGSTDE